jgi:hypothetical protein
MLAWVLTTASAIVLAFATPAQAQPAATHVRVASLSSTMDGVHQWIELEVVRVGTTPLVLKGRKLTVSDRHGGTRSFAFTDLADGAGPPSTLYVNASAWATAVEPYCDWDYCYDNTLLVPGYLLPIDGGTITIDGMDAFDYAPLPVQGCMKRLRDGTDVRQYGEWDGACYETLVAREYYHAGLDHYFTTTRADEMLALARGATPGWTPTGKAHQYPLTPYLEATSPVCRILLLDPVRYSHFLSASPAECSAVAAGGAAVIESPALFHVALPSDGACEFRYTHPSGAWKPVDLGDPVYRLWNGKVPPNHRYVTDPAERDAMIARGWVLEAAAANGAAWCAQASEGIPPGPTLP